MKLALVLVSICASQCFASSITSKCLTCVSKLSVEHVRENSRASYSPLGRRNEGSVHFGAGKRQTLDTRSGRARAGLVFDGTQTARSSPKAVLKSTSNEPESDLLLGILYLTAMTEAINVKDKVDAEKYFAENDKTPYLQESVKKAENYLTEKTDSTDLLDNIVEAEKYVKENVHLTDPGMWLVLYDFAALKPLAEIEKIENKITCKSTDPIQNSIKMASYSETYPQDSESRLINLVLGLQKRYLNFCENKVVNKWNNSPTLKQLNSESQEIFEAVKLARDLGQNYCEEKYRNKLGRKFEAFELFYCMTNEPVESRMNLLLDYLEKTLKEDQSNNGSPWLTFDNALNKYINPRCESITNFDAQNDDVFSDLDYLFYQSRFVGKFDVSEPEKSIFYVSAAVKVCEDIETYTAFDNLHDNLETEWRSRTAKD